MCLFVPQTVILRGCTFYHTAYFCVSYKPYNQQRSIPYIEFTSWFLNENELCCL